MCVWAPFGWPVTCDVIGWTGDGACVVWACSAAEVVCVAVVVRAPGE